MRYRDKIIELLSAGPMEDGDLEAAVAGQIGGERFHYAIEALRAEEIVLNVGGVWSLASDAQARLDLDHLCGAQ